MKGSYRIIISNAVLRYDFTIHRNITIIKGNSATGKTTLIEMMREYYESGENSGIQLKCDRPCRVLGGRDWKVLLETMKESIVFIDEGNDFLPSNEFAMRVRQSDNYYVIVTREGLPNLPYSVDEIYGIRESGKYASLKQTYNELYHIYGRYDRNSLLRPQCIIVEDSNSGFDFFKGIFDKAGISVLSAKGKSNIFSSVLHHADKKILVIADGAAFGPEMDRIMKIVRHRDGLVLYLPESFEWLILKSGIVPLKNLTNILDSPEDYIESSEYFSWERYFTALLTSETKDSYLRYSKNRLNPIYLQEEISDKITRTMTGLELSYRRDT